MHSRNRNLGNGYRSHSMVMGGVSTASRISPENSMREQGTHRSEYRSFNRGGYGQGQPRQFQRPPQQKHGDVFMEAGRLATEYLVSKGLIPSNVLTGKWNKDGFRNQIGANSTQFPSEGRTSALSRLGDSVSDVGPGRRRYQDDFDSLSSNDMRGRRRNVSSKNSSPDRSREFARSASLSVRSRASVVVDGDKVAFSPSCQDEQKIGNEGDMASLDPSPKLVPEKDIRGTVESTVQKSNLLEDIVAKESSPSCEKDLSMLGDIELLEKADDQDPHSEAGEIKDGSDYKVPEPQDTKDASTVVEAEKLGNVSSESSWDLIKFCNFTKVPTRTRSSMATRGSKGGVDSMTISVDTLQNEPPKESGFSAEGMAVNGLPDNDRSILHLDNLEVPSKEDELEVTPNNSLSNSTRSVSEVDTPSSKELVIKDNLSVSEIIESNQRGEKRASDHEIIKEENKKPRESAASEILKSEECLHHSDSLKRQPPSEDPMALVDGGILLPSDEKSLLDTTLSPKADIASCMDYTEEKQLFPSSFKTCDLNLMESSDVNESHKNNSILLFPSATKRRKQPILVDIDLSMSSNSLVSNNFGKSNIPGKDIEVIDLEDETEQEDMKLNNSNRRSDNVFTCLDGYSSSTHNGSDISEVQDGYGLMISELLANDMHSSSVPTDMNSLHGDLGLHNGEAILGDDDSVYMSLGEIPMSFLKDWEQSNQDYDKPF